MKMVFIGVSAVTFSLFKHRFFQIITKVRSTQCMHKKQEIPLTMLVLQHWSSKWPVIVGRRLHARTKNHSETVCSVELNIGPTGTECVVESTSMLERVKCEAVTATSLTKCLFLCCQE